VTAGANPTSLQRGIMQAVEAIVEELKKISRKVSDRKGDRSGRNRIGQLADHDRQGKHDDR
jgi:chaperonin GroEL (HSP60 family)